VGNTVAYPPVTMSASPLSRGSRAGELKVRTRVLHEEAMMLRAGVAAWKSFFALQSSNFLRNGAAMGAEPSSTF